NVLVVPAACWDDDTGFTVAEDVFIRIVIKETVSSRNVETSRIIVSYLFLKNPFSFQTRLNKRGLANALQKSLLTLMRSNSESTTRSSSSTVVGTSGAFFAHPAAQLFQWPGGKTVWMRILQTDSHSQVTELLVAILSRHFTNSSTNGPKASGV